MSDERVGIAILGAGAAAEAHARAIAGVPGTRVVTVHARDPAARRAFAARHGARAADSSEDAIRDPAVTVVIVATPSGTHGDLTMAAAHAGRHVLCEKPLDVTLAAAATAAEACHAAGVRLFPVFQGRFGVARHLLQAARSGRLGNLVNVRVSMKWRRDDAYYASAAWRGTRRLDGGGCLINQAIHGIDLALAAAGPAVSVQAEVANRSHPHLEVEDTVALLLRHRDGALTIFEATTSTDQEQPMEIEATGTRGTIAIAGNAIVRWQLADGSAPPTPEPDEPPAEAPETEHRSWKHRRQLADVLRALNDGRQPIVVVDDGLRALATVEAAYAAGRHGAAVTPKDLPIGAWASTMARREIGGARIIENATSCAAT